VTHPIAFITCPRRSDEASLARFGAFACEALHTQAIFLTIKEKGRGSAPEPDRDQDHDRDENHDKGNQHKGAQVHASYSQWACDQPVNFRLIP